MERRTMDGRGLGHGASADNAGAWGRRSKVTAVPAVTKIRMTIANAYLVRGERPVLVDTGGPGGAGEVLEALAKNGVSPEEVSLILLTHGHADHFGAAAELKRLTCAPVAAHELDAGSVRNGRNPYLPTTRLRARLLKPFLPHEAPAVEPDILFRGEMGLEQFGVRARVIETPGHTAGSVSVLLAGGEAIVGDVLMGGHMGGAFRPGVPRYHYFAEDLGRVRESLAKILALSPTGGIFVGHGGPLDPEAVRERFAGEIGATDVGSARPTASEGDHG